MDGTRPSISARVSRTAQRADGGWLTIELGADRHVINQNPDDDIPQARHLADQLTRAVAAALRAADDAPAAAAASPDSTADVLTSRPSTRECPDHDGAVMLIRRRPDGSHFYSHRDRSTGAAWCNYDPRVTDRNVSEN
jgi:hypothetical protein